MPSEFFLEEPFVASIGLCDAELDYLFMNKSLIPRERSTWFSIADIGVVRMEPLNEETIIVHAYLRRAFHGKKLLKYVFLDIAEHLIRSTKYRFMMVPVPKPCRHVSIRLGALGFKLAETLKEAIQWRQKTVDLLIYMRNIWPQEEVLTT